IEVESDVPIEVAIPRITRITFLLAPDLSRRLMVAAEGGDAVRGENGSKRPVPRPRPRVQDTVCFQNKPADVCLLQKIFHTGDVRAFRQPDPPWIAAETGPIMVPCDQDLRPDG